MANGQQLSNHNFSLFSAWISSNNDSKFRSMASRGVLSRTEIAKECGFAKSVLDQNPRIKAALHELEVTLRLRGVLPPKITISKFEDATCLVRESTKLHSVFSFDRLQRLETDNAMLKAEVAELRMTLDKYLILRDALARTGRVPR